MPHGPGPDLAGPPGDGWQGAQTMSEFGKERTCILSDDWPDNGQIPLTYQLLPAIALWVSSHAGGAG